MSDLNVADTGRLPVDDSNRDIVIARPNDRGLQSIFLMGDTYTILVTTKQTNGQYCLIDMLVHDGGGPPPHRHDFEEMFTLIDGELEFMFRGETLTIAAPATINIPANAPHCFKNKSGRTAHMLCLCSPGGQDEFFSQIGIPVDSRSSSPPQLSKAEMDAKRKLAEELAPKYRTEFVV